MEHGPRYRYALVIHVRRSVCECVHAFTLKREARITASSPVKCKRALESMENTLRRQEKNRTRMASMRGSETQEQILERLEQNRTRIASMSVSETLHVKLHKKRKHVRTRTVPVEGAIAAFHSEVKLGPCTSVLRIVLYYIIINLVYIASIYTIFRIAHQGTFILRVFINTD